MLIGLVLLAVSCSNDADQESTLEGYAPVTIRVNDFSISVENFSSTRAEQSVADYTNVKAITLAFYDSNNTEVYNTTQLRADNTTYTTFGTFSCALPMGSYTMVVLGYGSENAMTLSSKTNATFTNDRVRDTFVYTQAVNITSTAAIDLSATLSRVVSRLEVASTDGRTANAAQIRTTFSAGGQGVNPITGFATSNTGFSNTVEITKAVGQTAGSINYLFLNTDEEQTMTVTIDVLNENDNSISHKVVSNVPFKRNRVTKLKGSLFSASATATFKVEADWIQETEINF